MKKINLIIPYIGELNSYQLLAIEQLSLLSEVDVNLVIDKENYDIEYIFRSSITLLDINEIFVSDNILNVKLKDLLDFPYKLCDLKPFYNIIFNINYDAERYYAFCDIDCIYNVKVLDSILIDINDSNGVYGDRGHLMIFGKDALNLVQIQLIESIRKYKEKNVNLLRANKGYALDEFLFMHVILRRLQLDQLLTWYDKAFYPYFDVDYKNVLPKNYKNYGFIKISLTEIYEDDKICGLSYIHLQKRKICGDVSSLYNGGMLNLNFDIKTGSAILSNSDKYGVNPLLINKVKFYCNVLFRRVKYRLINYGFGKRPSLK